MAVDKENIVKQINDSFASNDLEGFLTHCAEDVKWTMAGDKTSVGKETIREWMKAMEGHDPPKFTVDKMISNDDSVVCCGDMTMKGQSGSEEAYSYCDIYQFDGEKVIELRSYVVREKSDEKELSAAG